MAEYGVYAQPNSSPPGYRCIISVFTPLIGTGPGQDSLYNLVQRSVPMGIPFGIFEYPSEAYPVDYDFDSWYPTEEETDDGIGTQPT